MKQLHYLLLALVAMSLNGCFYTISTVTPAPAPVTTTVVKPSYTTTTVCPPVSTKPVTTVVVQTSTNLYTDPCLYLDLHAVAAALAESRTVQDFELRINSSRYMISNLDLNRDGYVDYLRVREAVSGWNHVLVIQAVLGYRVYQDVATVVVERSSTGIAYVQVIGEPYLYGPKYIIEPVFRRTPLIYTGVRYGYYTVWQSPYDWNHYPSCYAHSAPQQLGHYQAYVTTYCHNHDYCRETYYADHYHYSSYETVRHPISCNDYARQNPQQSFSSRAAELSRQSGGVPMTNARDVRRATTTTSSSATTPSRTTTTATPATPSRTTTTTTTTPSRTTTTTAPATPTRPATTTTPRATTTTTRVTQSGTPTRTSVRSTAEDGTTTSTTTRTSTTATTRRTTTTTTTTGGPRR